MNTWKIMATFFGSVAVIMGTIAIFEKPKSIYKNKPVEQNPFEGKSVRFVYNEAESENADGVHGHLEEIPDSDINSLHKRSLYGRVVKRFLDLLFSFAGIVVLAPILLILSLAVFFDDPGPVLFTQKRVGKNKRFFKLHKFRSMKMSTPHDVPTHMLNNPDSYITKTGRLLRIMSLDELPQLWDIFIGNMSLVGPRPGLWNQDVLIAMRDEYGANDVMPGLTGWAQINGRDELELEVKAKLDGEYCRNLTFRMDLTCIIATFANVIKHNGVVEGGTGVLQRHIKNRQDEIKNSKRSK